MRIVYREGDDGEIHRFREYGPDELGSETTAPFNHPRTAELAMLTRLFGSHDKSGPLMDACRRSAEHVHRGGHSPATQRQARREVLLHEGAATLS